MAAKKINKLTPRQRRKIRVRKKIIGTEANPRLCVFRSNKYIYAQVISDNPSKVICSANSKELVKDGCASNKEAAAIVGKKIAEAATEKKIEKVVFDRNGYLFHGRVEALANAARESGLKF